MTEARKRVAAKEFAEYWKDKGKERSEGQKFWLALLRNVFEIDYPEKYIDFEIEVQLDNTKYADGYILSTKVLIEQKGKNKDLRKKYPQSGGIELTPFEQAIRYRSKMPYSMQPRYIIICNFQEFHVYDMEKPNEEPVIVLLENFEEDYKKLLFLTNPDKNNIHKEIKVSFDAGKIIGDLYDLLLEEYKNKTSPNTLKSLNRLCVRLVFCLYAEDAGIFEKDLFYNYMKQFEAKHMRKNLLELFRILDTPDKKRDKYDEELNKFPYVNGGLFTEEDNEIPNFTEKIRDYILKKASEQFDWSEISPTIFGAIFESTLNPETRRKGGMHYTSIENIHKVIDPLFLDELNEEFYKISKAKTGRDNKLRKFQEKLANLNFLDPACGSGNFLTETYISLRKLENSVLEELYGDNKLLNLEGEYNPIKVSINQFYGIEINDFAVTVAKTALWIAESQMMRKTEDIVHMDLNFLPLKTYPNIIEGNALHMNWEDVISKDKLNYIMGNPPFIGSSLQNEEQKKDSYSILIDKSGKPYKMAGRVDYVACWYFKAAQIMSNKPSPLVGEGKGEGSVQMKISHFYTKESLLYSKDLRKNMTPAEKLLWYYLRNRQLAGLKFRRQEAFGKYILDFVCYEQKLVIELDGSGHLNDKQKEHDIIRNKFIEQNGYKIIRIFNNEVQNNIEGVLEYILKNIKTPHPNPLPQGAREIKTALVSTNSITQGEQVAGIWKPLYERFGIHIDFAHKTFRWDSESNSKAHVHCVIIGFSCTKNNSKKKLYTGERMQLVDNINAYLLDAPDIFIENCSKPLCNVPSITKGAQPTDGGNLIIEECDYEKFIENEPNAKKYIKKLVGATEFINNKNRYCLWLINATPNELHSMPFVIERLKKVKKMRINSSDPKTRIIPPHLFRETYNPNTFIIIPSTSSEQRKYIPMGFRYSDTISTNANLIVPEAKIYHFGVLESSVHMAWVRAVCGRLEMRYRYSKDIVYNNFPWCNPTEEQKTKIEKTAQGILNARNIYPDCSLADLYDELTMPPELRKAHQENDKAVMEVYGFKTKDEITGKTHWLDESEIVTKLMDMYQKLIQKQ